jgi:methyl-accepting chemotaxis protein
MARTGSGARPSTLPDGSIFAQEAGITMDDVGKAVKRVTEVIGEISAACAEISSEAAAREWQRGTLAILSAMGGHAVAVLRRG